MHTGSTDERDNKLFVSFLGQANHLTPFLFVFIFKKILCGQAA